MKKHMTEFYNHPIYDRSRKNKYVDYIHDIRRRFTMWYIRKGYSFEYISNAKYIFKAVWDCPWWIRPLLIFFSPSTYHVEVHGKAAVKGFEEGLKQADESPLTKAQLANATGKTLEPENCPFCGGEARAWEAHSPELALTTYHCGCEHCGYYRSSCMIGKNGAIAKWNDFVKRYSEMMKGTSPIFKKN